MLETSGLCNWKTSQTNVF